MNTATEHPFRPAPGCTLLYMSYDVHQVALERAAREIEAARTKLDAAMEEARVAALEAIAAGVSELAVTKTLKLHRLTVRRWQGKG
jgi:hypothetical protein